MSEPRLSWMNRGRRIEAIERFEAWWDENCYAVTHANQPGRESEAEVATAVMDVFKRLARAAWLASAGMELGDE